MSQSDYRRDNLADCISDMETDVVSLLRWGIVVSDLGSSDNCTREGAKVVGEAIEDVAKRVKESWEAAFRLSRDIGRGA